MMPSSGEELINPVKKSLEKSLPVLKRDGGGLEFLGVKNGVVYVRLIGVCKDCASNGITLRYSLERQFRVNIRPGISIIDLKGGEQEFAKL